MFVNNDLEVKNNYEYLIERLLLEESKNGRRYNKNIINYRK